MNLIYLRVSTNEKRQDLDQQLKAILDKFGLKEEDCVIIKDQGSAYQMEKIHKREGFLRLLDQLFSYSSTTIKDLFLSNITLPKEEINIYVWDYSRIMRNMVKNLLFYILVLEYGIKVRTYKDMGLFDENIATSPNGRLIAFINNLIVGHTAQAYSEQISKDISRAYDQELRGSTRGMVWGLGFTPNDNWTEYWSNTIQNNKGEELQRLTESGRLRLTISEKGLLDRYIKKILSMGYMRKDVIKMVAGRKGILINHTYLSKHFKGD